MQQQLIALGTCVQPAATAVRHGVRGLQKQQALLGRSGKDSPAVSFLDDVLVVFLRLEAEQRKSKAVLSAARLGVARAGIATGLGQDRHDVIDEVQRARSDSDARLDSASDRIASKRAGECDESVRS